MTVATGAPDLASVVRALSDANVQFVVVGEPAAGSPLTLVISRHPTNLEALGRALDGLASTVRTVEPSASQAKSPDATESGADRGAGTPRRVGDPMGTIALTTSAGDVDLLLGGPRRSLYAEVSTHAHEREVGGMRVKWADELPPMETGPRVTSRILGRRLLSLAEGLAHLMDRHGESPDGDEGADA